MGYFNQLKEKWGVTSNFQFWVIFIVFGITGSTSVKVGRPFLDIIGLNPEVFQDFPLGAVLYWILRIIAIFPIYQVLLLLFGALFFQFTFFWEFEKKIFRKMGLKRFFPEP